MLHRPDIAAGGNATRFHRGRCLGKAGRSPRSGQRPRRVSRERRRRLEIFADGEIAPGLCLRAAIGGIIELPAKVYSAVQWVSGNAGVGIYHHHRSPGQRHVRDGDVPGCAAPSHSDRTGGKKIVLNSKLYQTPAGLSELHCATNGREPAATSSHRPRRRLRDLPEHRAHRDVRVGGGSLAASALLSCCSSSRGSLPARLERRSSPPLRAQRGRCRSAVEVLLGVESEVLNTGRRSSAVVACGVESLPGCLDAGPAGRANCLVVSSGPGELVAPKWKSSKLGLPFTEIRKDQAGFSAAWNVPEVTRRSALRSALDRFGSGNG